MVEPSASDRQETTVSSRFAMKSACTVQPPFEEVEVAFDGEYVAEDARATSSDQDWDYVICP